jgi:hypothetical protein
MAYFDRRVSLPNDKNRRSLDYARDDKFIRVYAADVAAFLTQRKPMLEAELSGVFEVRAATR